jgi:hypothetical protein
MLDAMLEPDKPVNKNYNFKPFKGLWFMTAQPSTVELAHLQEKPMNACGRGNGSL